jgi:hypothetical protein
MLKLLHARTYVKFKCDESEKAAIVFQMSQEEINVVYTFGKRFRVYPKHYIL